MDMPGEARATLFGKRIPDPPPPAKAVMEPPDDGIDDLGPWKRERGTGKVQFGINFIKPDGETNGFEYSGLVRRHWDASGTTITLFFLADALTKVTIRGNGLRDLFSDIQRHRCFEVRAAARDAGQSGPVVTGITVEEVKEKGEG